jgi:hypothetical protein
MKWTGHIRNMEVVINAGKMFVGKPLKRPAKILIRKGDKS